MTPHQINEILVVVHPGSACGTADFNLDRLDARAARQALCHELRHWSGGVLIIDGALSQELPAYPLLNAALLGALNRARTNGHVAMRMRGCGYETFNQVKAIGRFVKEMGPALQGAHFTLTGAWYNNEGGGCVGSVKDELARLGIGAVVADSVVWEASEPQDDEALESAVGAHPSQSAPSPSSNTVKPRRARP